MLGINLSVMQLHRMPARPVPSAFAPQDWSLTDAATGGALVVRTLRLPDDGGAGLTTLEISLDGGEWRVLNAASLGAFLVTGLTDHVETSVRLRAVSDVGAGAASEPARATPTPLPVAPGMIAAPEISGAAVVGATLIASGGLWAGEPAPALAWVWRRDGVSIKGAEGAEYRVAPEDEDRDIDVLVTATNRVGAASALAAVTRIAARFPITTKEIPPQAAALGDWWGLDLSEYASADTSLSFALTEGALPAGVLFDDQAGMVHGAPTEGGVRALTFEARTATGARSIPVSLSVRREMSNVTTGGAYLTRASALGLAEGPGLRRQMTFAARFTIPTDIAATAVIFDVAGRHTFRVFSSGKISVNIHPPEIGPAVASWTSTGAVNDGLEHTLVVTVDLNDTAPTVDVTLDGEAMAGSFSTAPIASELAVNRNGYGVGAYAAGTGPLPANAALRWLYVSFDDAIPGADFEGVADPATLGSPSLFFGGLASDWNAGTNFGAVEGAFTAVGSFTAQGDEAVLDPTPRAFPGATGHGRYTTGGRGGATIRVTTSADTGPGSLREALLTPGARYVLIEPGVGPIWLESGALEVPSALGDLTIDARRAPDFFLSMSRLAIRASNVLVRGLRIYAGGEGGQTATQTITGETGTAGNKTNQPAEYWEWGDTRGQEGYNRHCLHLGDYTNESSTWTGNVQTRVYLDHCEFGWGPDKVISIFPLKQSFAPNYVGPAPCSDITFDGCMAFESLFASHVNPDNKTTLASLLVLIGERCERISFNGNLFATSKHRFPEINKWCRGIDLVNHWNANWGQNCVQLEGSYTGLEAGITDPVNNPALAAQAAEAQSQLNVVRCVFDEGSATQDAPGGRAPIMMVADVPDRLHIADLEWNAPDGTAVSAAPTRPLLGKVNAAGEPNGPMVNVSATPVSPLSVTPLPAEVDLRAWVAANVGARNPDGTLHPIAARIVAQAAARTLPSWGNLEALDWPDNVHNRGGPRGQWKVSWATEASTPGQPRLDRPDDAHLIYSPGGALKAAVA